MLKTLSLIFLLLVATNVTAVNVEVLHYWTSSSEQAALLSVKQALAKKGDNWQDFAVAGGAGESAYSVLQTRAIAGNPPGAALLEGKAIEEWARLGFLSSPYTPEQTVEWDQVLPLAIKANIKYRGEYVAVPVNIHRINWMWINPKPFAKLKLAVPTTWDEFFAVADKLQAAGYIPLAHGGQAWQDATVFENLLLGMEGGEFYRQVFMEQRSSAITSEKMVRVLEEFRKLKGYIDPDAANRPWHESVEMLRSGKAAMMIMGDWAKGEMMQDGDHPGQAFLCVVAPGTKGYFIYNTDSFAILQQNGNPVVVSGQRHLADVLMDKQFQVTFNKLKGSIPARMDVSLQDFDSCAQQSGKAFRDAEASGKLLPSMAHSMATDAQTKEIFFHVLNSFFIHPEQTPQQAVQQLNTALIAVKS
ncbi:ABC transporter substrate-binding protein [Yersinia intermedia]|uniref:ABC transporter substrate-binding protein n=1 Tax=Yersinia intermedia TaxID=631 RepID=UPI001F52F814|nr:ABC transporter substrate-binding protein [Yersinia intermedia]UNK23972.1 ABC transporter substrate-binding protein [Yersinia intermedia]